MDSFGITIVEDLAVIVAQGPVIEVVFPAKANVPCANVIRTVGEVVLHGVDSSVDGIIG